MSLPTLGIDIAKKTFQVCLLHNNKKYNHTFPNQPDGFRKLTVWLDQLHIEKVHACLEATGRYWEELALYLHTKGHLVSVVNPARIRNYIRSKLLRNKTDKLDAEQIADFCATQNPEPWTPSRPEVRELQALVRHLEALQVMHTQEKNRLAAGNPSEQVKQMLEEHLNFIEKQISELENHIQEHIDRHPSLKRQQDLLISIPGIGKLTAAKLLGENIQSFTSTRKLVAYAGLSPARNESGTSVHRKAKLSKIGKDNLRKALYFPAIVARRFNPVLRVFCARLEKRGKHEMVIIGAAMRKLLCLALGVLKSGVPFDPNYSLNIQATA